MAIKTIIELEAKPGQREKLIQALDLVLEGMKAAPGFLGANRYEVIDNPDSLIEIAEWQSSGARQAWLEQSMTSGLLPQLISTLGAPYKAITIKKVG